MECKKERTGGRNGPGHATLSHDLVHLPGISDIVIRQALDIDSFRLLLVDLEVVVLGFRGPHPSADRNQHRQEKKEKQHTSEKIADPFHINLHVADLDEVFQMGWARENRVEDLLGYTWDQTFQVWIIDVGSLSGTKVSPCFAPSGLWCETPSW
jgi:hypothetical protein